MKFFKYRIGFVRMAFILLFVLIYPLTAEAYIDPGTGSVIIQAVIASIAVAGIYFRAIWRRVSSIFMYFSNKKIKNLEDNKEKLGEEDDNNLNEQKESE